MNKTKKDKLGFSTTLNVDLLTQFRQYCYDNGMKIQAAVEKALVEYMNKESVK